MLLFPVSQNTQKLFVNHPCSGPRSVRVESVLPADTEIILHGGDEHTELSELPAITVILLSANRQDVGPSLPCVIEREAEREFAKYAYVALDHKQSQPAQLELILSYMDVLFGKSKRWKPKEIHFTANKITFRCCNGKDFADIVLEGFAGNMLFYIPSAYKPEINRCVQVHINPCEYEHAYEMEIDSHIPDGYIHDQDWLRSHNHCVEVSAYLRRCPNETQTQVMYGYSFQDADCGVENILSTGILEGLLEVGRNGYYQVRL